MKKLALIAGLAFFSLSAMAQDYSWRLTYDVSIPTGTFSEKYISQASWRGIGIDNRWAMSEKFSVGFNVAWHTFYEQKNNQYASSTDGSIVVFGNQFRYLNIYTFQANAHYYLSESGKINPWVGLSVGTSYSEQRAEIGLIALTYKPWSFAVTPQIGIDIPINMSTDLMIGVRYNIHTNGKVDYDYQYVGINAGFKVSVF